LEIAEVIRLVLDRHRERTAETLDDVLEADRDARVDALRARTAIS